MKYSHNIIVFAYGVGGHKAQMYRLVSGLNIEKDKDDLWYVYTDDDIKPEWADYHFTTSELRSKTSKTKFYMLDNFISTLRFFKTLQAQRKNIKLISTGPGHVIILAFLIRLFGGTVIHVETWSRFYSKSLTGRLMYLISNKFYVQNKELLSLYKKSIFSGRL